MARKSYSPDHALVVVRYDEFRQLVGAFAQGHHQLMTIVGTGGIGKSEIVKRTMQETYGGAGWLLLKGKHTPLEQFKKWSSGAGVLWRILLESSNSRRKKMGPYSSDLRTRVMQDVEAGMSAEKAAVKYSVSARTIYAWKALLRETGCLSPRQGGSGRPRKLVQLSPARR